MTWWIMTTDENRREQWDRALGMNSLPVTTHKPMMIRRGRFRLPYFMVDADALTTTQRMRLIGWIWKTKRVTAVAAMAMVEAGVLIDGRDCEVVEPVEDYSPALLFGMAYG